MISVETLARYLADHQPKLKVALEVVDITPQAQVEKYPPLSTTTVEDLFALPNAPWSALTAEQLLRFAQIVDTALYKPYWNLGTCIMGKACLQRRWVSCESKSLTMLFVPDLSKGRRLSEKETDTEDKLEPSITYLQKLGRLNILSRFSSHQDGFSARIRIRFQGMRSTSPHFKCILKLV